ncbi:hypothetical protein H2200_007732 [Cladophialophora chaetospira]|uniref:Uncharacterized protein n=1 Tax=Cladophialophora chaetospira TaxID=386627 RepID=A0AA38X6H1_9EURO|nr:hypothetical protein H2200_007732 [Cladophialophora chaetospira]
MFPKVTLPYHGRNTLHNNNNNNNNIESTQGHNEIVHPRLRRLSSSHTHPRCCSKCHMRVPSQEHLPPLIRHSSTSSEEEWDGFCPDIPMPSDLTHSLSRHSLQRRHSGLCPKTVSHHERKNSCGSPVQMLVKEHAAEFGHHQKDCNCEMIIPQENLDERYGLLKEREQIRPKRDSLDQEAAGRLAEIMRGELVSDLKARQRMQ